jgi:heptosyltransferase-3
MNILFVSSLRIGDAVLSTGLLAYFSEGFPEVRSAIACGPLPAPIFAHAPCGERVIALHKRSFAGHWLGLWTEVVGTAWDLVVDLRGSALSWTLWAKKRRVFRWVDYTIQHGESLGRFFALDEPPALRIWWSATEEAFAAKNIGDGSPVLALGPTANWAGKIWLAQRFTALLGRLAGADSIFPDGRIAVFGAAGERNIVLPVLQAIPPERCINQVGTVDILTAATCLNNCDLFVGNDSGLMYMAAAIGTPHPRVVWAQRGSSLCALGPALRGRRNRHPLCGAGWASRFRSPDNKIADDQPFRRPGRWRRRGFMAPDRTQIIMAGILHTILALVA